MLEIQPQPSTELPFQQFALVGSVDVESIPQLATLYVLPKNSAVEFDFALVQRVNSMGLAQLLKLFEYWEERGISINIKNTSRMIGVLFKMTGLSRFLAGAPAVASPAAQTLQPQATYTLAQEDIAPVKTDDTLKLCKIKLWVSAQNNSQMNGWYFFNTYLQRHLGREVQMELVHSAMNPQQKIETMDIVFAKPFEATRLLLEHRFRPLLRPVNQTDEVTLLVRADESRQKITDFRGCKVVTAAPDNFVYLLGRFLLEEEGIASEELSYVFSGHDIRALQALLKREADILFMLTDTYNSLSSLAKKMLRKIDQSETAVAFHLFCAAPHCIDVGNAVTVVLSNMKYDSQGQKVLADLKLDDWSKPGQDEIDMLVMLFNRYAASDKQRKL